MCLATGPNNNNPLDKLKSTANVDRTNKSVPTPPKEIDNTNIGPVFGPDNSELEPINEEDVKVIKSIKFCSYEPDEPGIYQCVAKTDPEGEKEPKVFSCTAKTNPDPKDPSSGIYQCVAKVKPDPFIEIKHESTELKDLFKTKENAEEIEIPKAGTNRKPGYYNCDFKVDPNKKDDKPGFYNCNFKSDPDKKENKPGFYSCVFKTDENNSI